MGHRGIWSSILAALTEEGWIAETAQIDSSYIKAHRCAGGAKGGSSQCHWRFARRLDDEDSCARRCPRATTSPRTEAGQYIGYQRRRLARRCGRGNEAPNRRSRIRRQSAAIHAPGSRYYPIIPGRRNRKRPIQYDERRYRDRWRVEAMFCRLKDFRRVATRYNKLARNYQSAVGLAAAVAFWL